MCIQCICNECVYSVQIICIPDLYKVMHPRIEEVRQEHQEVYVHEQGAPVQSQTQKETLQSREGRTDSLGGTQRDCLSSQG